MFDEMVGKVILLDNNKYYHVIWSKEIEGRLFLYLLNQNDFSEPLFCEKISDAYLKEIEDKEFIKKIILLIAREINTFAI